MKMSKQGIERLIKSEGVRYQVYDDRNSQVIYSFSEAIGYPTIGVGHLIYHPSIGVDQRERFSKFLGGQKKMSHQEVISLLREDLPKYEKPVKERLNKPITNEMFDSLVSLAFNAGPNHRSVKNATNLINEEKYEEAAEAIRNGPTTSGGVTLSGLIKRRNEEADWFMSGGLPKRMELQKFVSDNKTAIQGAAILITLGAIAFTIYKYR